MFDTNVFLLWVVGNRDPALISEIKETADCSADDFLRLQHMSQLARTRVVNSAILAESCNLLERHNEKRSRSLFPLIRELTAAMNGQDMPLAAVMSGRVFDSLGFTDSSLFELACQGFLVVTKEAKLTGWLMNEDLPVLNLNHLRSADWLGG